jgi:hypothetical protein
MKNEHLFDPEFKFASDSLKKAISIIPEKNMRHCVDMPAGNGRNVFFLSQFFKIVTAVDINENYLRSIVDSTAKYKDLDSTIITSKIDLKDELPREIQSCEFICTIHYFSYSLIRRVIEKMKKSSYYYIETPNCIGANFLKLPTETELTWLLKDVNLMFFEMHNCKSPNIHDRHLAFKCLLAK